jgi:hypothetical protein
MIVDVRGHFHVPDALSRQRFVGTNSVSEWLDSTAGLDVLLEKREIFVSVGDVSGVWDPGLTYIPTEDTVVF